MKRTLLSIMTSTALAFALAGLGACSGGDEESGVASGGSGGAGGSGGTIGGSTGSGGSVQIDGGGSGGSSGSSGSSSGCTKTDFLFVIDSSISMQNEQAALTAAFPKFIEAITTATTIDDFHIMIVDTDAETRCTASACAGTPHQTCNAYACDNVYGGCDATRGAGVIQPTGQASSNTICPIASGKRYMDNTQPELSATFQCVATLGLAGNPSERPMEAMVAAVSSELNGPGGCNEGFLRDDAILVVTFISDDLNKEDTGTPEEWYDAVVSAKGGNPESVVMLGLIPEGDSASPTQQLHWHDFIALWGTRGMKGTVSAADYAPFFDAAIATIDDTCNNFVPPPQ
jgi:hypothetical protein